MPNCLDDYVAAQMQEHRIPGVALAVMAEGQLAHVRSYGFTDQAGKSPITRETIFQAASISKCLAAFAALRLVDEKKLSLDEDVKAKLKSWKIPANEFTTDEPVTLRRLLSHSAGVTVHGFSGYTVGSLIPALGQVLDGLPPANNTAIRLDAIPGEQARYSGGGFTIVQQLLMDVMDQPFPELMHSLVLQPLGMPSSTFEQPLPDVSSQKAARGHFQNGKPVPGGSHVYPEMAAAGLWSTPSDLARFVIGIQQSLAGQPGSLLSLAITREMLTPQADGYGLGWILLGNGPTLKFFHSGRNAGFDAALMGDVKNGKGMAIMINANSDPKIFNSLLKAVAKQFI